MKLYKVFIIFVFISFVSVVVSVMKNGLVRNDFTFMSVAVFLMCSLGAFIIKDMDNFIEQIIKEVSNLPIEEQKRINEEFKNGEEEDEE